MGLESREGKAAGVGRGKQKIITRNCGKKAFSINIDKLPICTFKDSYLSYSNKPFTKPITKLPF